MASEKEVAIYIKDVYKTYGKGNNIISVLSNVSVIVEKGTTIVVTGESGSGKTTLLSIVSGLDNIDSGVIQIGDFTVSQATERERSFFRLKNIGFVFQYHYLLEDFNALENVMLPLQMLGYKKQEAMDKAEEILMKIGLWERAFHHPSQLSGGECQRTAIARALVHRPNVIFADEPTGALDTKNSENIRTMLSTLAKEYGTTLFIATHDEDFLYIADIHYHLQDGIIQKGKRV